MSVSNYRIYADETGTADALFKSIDKAIANGAQALMILACDNNHFSPAQLDNKLQSLPVPIFGGIFPQILRGPFTYTTGSLVCALNTSVVVDYIHDLSKANADNEFYTTQAEQIRTNHLNRSTLLVTIDGLSKRISTLLDSLYEVFGTDYKYIGGGAGSLSFQQKPCIFSNDGLLSDCAQIASITLNAHIGIEHGWQKFSGPFLVTGAYENIITTLDYRPARQVYKEIVEADCGQTLSDDNFFEIAKAYPLGIERLDADIVVRDPLTCEGDNIVCVGEVPANHTVYLLKGNAKNLLAASQRVVKDALTPPDLITPDFSGPALFFDCISRVLFLEKRFNEELAGITYQLPVQNELIGALSIGEIASNKQHCLEVHNKTAVLSLFTQPSSDAKEEHAHA